MTSRRVATTVPATGVRGFKPSRRAFLQGAAGVGIGIATGGLAHGFLYERFDLGITRSTLPVSGLPEALRGLRVGLITDTHRSETVSHEMIEAAVRLLMSERPDLIVLGGDYVTWGNRRYVQPSADALAPLSAPHGVLAILGNHDDDRDMPAALAAKGFTVLKDARTRLVIRGEPVDFAGIRFWTHKISDLTRVLRGALPCTILLAHTPWRLYEAQRLAIPAVICGHTHGGQIVLPGIGPIAGRGFPVLAGLARREGTSIFVSRGVGTVYVPVRINCPPEVAVLTLEPVMQSS
jgi:predicted MPP superfamily phosphohydrolase